ncbi:MAG: T9SS type A sorting domain-containing protein [candidate division KSB1 bacterium]|nr:T9SS type A sorting domain-containing protein [candidate division KSB1 bacterium]
MRNWFFVLLLVPFALFSAEVQVEPGDATLSAAIAAANNGDVLVLQDGGEYRETDQTVLPIAVDGIELTIKAEDGYSTRPVISFPAFPSGGNIAAETFGFELSDCDFTVQGLEFDCGMADTSQYKALAALFNISWETTLQMIDKFTIDDCFIHHLFWPWGRVVHGESGDHASAFVGIDSCIVTNSLFYKAPKAMTTKNAILNFLWVENNTFWQSDRKSIRAEDRGNGSNPEIHILHNTFYALGDRAMQLRYSVEDPNSITIKNNIFAKIVGDLGAEPGGDNVKDPIQIRDNENTMVEYNLFYMTDAINIADSTDAKNNWWDVDPKFANAPLALDPGPDADFTLAEDSPALGEADDGTALGDVRWDPTATAVASEPVSTPNGFTLKQNYPNPFNPATTIEFNLSESGWTTLTVHNTLGQIVSTLVDESLNAGSHSIQFNASDLPSGIYVYRISAGSQVAEKKMLLIK